LLRYAVIRPIKKYYYKRKDSGRSINQIVSIEAKAACIQLLVLPLTLKDHPQTIATFWSQVDHPVKAADHIKVVLDYPHNSRPNPASAAALLRHEDAATSAAGALDADSNGSEATAE
jgi:hypothetical protein